MRSLFPVRRPRAGLAFSESAVSVVELAPRWRGPNRIRHLATKPLPPGLLRPDPTGANIADPAELTTVIRDLLRAMTQRTLAISMPMACAHAALFAFETLSDREADRLAILRWRFQQEHHLAVGDAEVMYRVYPSMPSAGKPQSQRAEGTGPTVLAVALSRVILTPYLAVLEEAGVLPASVSWSTLQLFDLAWPLMGQAEEMLCVYHSPHSWALMAVRDGQPAFLRVKPGCQPHEEEAAIRGTLQYYHDLYPQTAAHEGQHQAVLYRLREDCFGADGPEETGHVLEPVPGSAWRVRSASLDWSRLNLQGPRPTAPSEWAALAGVLAS